MKGHVIDTNSSFLCKELYEIGIKVLSVLKVPDELDVIAEEVKKYSEKYDYVLTTGGIGPTHDDITYEAVAKAFDDTLYYHPDLSKLVLSFYKTSDINHPALKMAYIPTTATLTYGIDPGTKKKSFYPSISVKNVYMFPGVPQLCERIFNLTKEQLFKSHKKFFHKELYVSLNEGTIVQDINDAVNKYPDVLFGSYPKIFHSYYTVKISMESTDEIEVNKAFEYLAKLISKQFHVNYDTNPFIDKSKKISQFKELYLLDTLNRLETLFKQSSPDEIFLYFDGGKNSTILLHITSTLFDKLFPGASINAIYVESNPKINRFVDETVKNYKMNLLKLSKDNFRNFAKSSSKIRVIKGIRKTDPNMANVMKSFEGLNVENPMSNWNYHNVWTMIRNLYLPYCELYDQGYTSICQSDSSPNPNLKTTGPHSHLTYYKKAFQLEDESLECAR